MTIVTVSMRKQPVAVTRERTDFPPMQFVFNSLIGLITVFFRHANRL